MKYYSLLLLACLLGWAASGQSPEEKRLLKCIYGKFRAEGINLKATLGKFEDELVSEGFLADDSGAAYIQLYRKIQEDNSLLIYTDMDWSALDRLPAEELFYACFGDEAVAGPVYRTDSKLIELSNELSRLTVVPVPSLKTIAGIYLKVMSAEDFNNELYRLTALWSFYEVHQHLNDHLELVVIDRDPAEIAPRNLLKIEVDGDRTLLNGKPIGLERLDAYLRAYLSSDTDHPEMPEMENSRIEGLGVFPVTQAHIQLSSSSGTQISQTLNVYRHVRAVYGELWDQRSRAVFGLPYDALDPEDRERIRAMVPIRLLIPGEKAVKPR